jgi:hypothetical protein
VITELFTEKIKWQAEQILPMHVDGDKPVIEEEGLVT